MLRHTFAVQCEDAGVKVSTISALLNHSNLSITHTYLSHLSGGDAGDQLNAVELPALAGAMMTSRAVHIAPLSVVTVAWMVA